MKHIPLLALLALLAVAPTLRAQNHQYIPADSAAMVVDRYLAMVSADRLPADSVLHGVTMVYTPGEADTVRMHRWFAASGAMRVEQYVGDTLIFGLYTDGLERYRRYRPEAGWWDDMGSDNFHRFAEGFDYRPPLQDWRANGVRLAYRGTTRVKEAEVQVVRVDREGYLGRLYLFEQRNGLLLMLTEDGPGPDGIHRQSFNHVDLKVCHEYLPVGRMLLPVQESFVRNGQLTVMETTWQLLAKDDTLFDRDRWRR